jgi:hypothetical protein
MGNCQAAEAAAVVIQHPGGKVERLYWPTTAADVMRANPGHYVALVILRISADKAASAAAAGDNKTNAGGSTGVGGGGAKITRVKLLKPKDTLLLGQVYRLITSQEVTKALRARKNEKMRRCEAIRQQHEQLRRGDPLAGVAEEEEEEESASDDQVTVPAFFFLMSRLNSPPCKKANASRCSRRRAGREEGPAPELRRRRAAGRRRQRPALAAVAAEHLRGREPERRRRRRQQHL